MANLNETIGRLARPLTSLISLGADKGYLSLDIGSSSIKMVEVHGQGSTLYRPDPEEVVALINIGAGYSSLTIMKGGRSSFTGDVSIGGEQFTDLLAQEFGINWDQAEEAKISGFLEGYDKEDIDRALSVTSKQLLDEIQRSLSFFWTAATEETGLDTSSKLAPALGQMGALFGRLSRGGSWSKSTRPTFQENVGPGSGHYNLPLRTSPLWVAEPTRTGRKAVS